MQLSWIELIIMSILSLFFIICGLANKKGAKKKTASCTKETMGTVIEHVFLDKGRIEPVVEYKVKGKKYTARRRIKGVKHSSISGTPNEVTEAYEDEKGWLHVKLGSNSDMRRLAESLWPIGSKMKVYYNPSRPKTCYVDRPNPDMFSFALLLSGFLILGISIVVFFLMRL